jgi:hypothetical protein
VTAANLANIKLGPDPNTWPEPLRQIYEARLRARPRDSEFKRTYRNNPVAFTHDCIDWKDDKPTAYQDEILDQLAHKRRVAVRAPHGAGKTAIASLAVLWFALTRDGEDWKCPTTASAWRQLQRYLWPEIHKWARRVKWAKVQRDAFDLRSELLQINLKLRTGEAFAVASDNHELIEGAHADSLLYLFDEAKAIPSATFDAAEGAFSTGEAFALAISTPGEPSGRFYDIHRRAQGYDDWYVKHVTLDEAIASGRINADWATQRALQWGTDSAVYKNRVLGEFCASDEDCVIPLAWIEAANRRWEEWKDNGGHGAFTCVGVDVGRSESGDKTVLARRHDTVITQLDRYSVADTMSVSGYVSGILQAHGGYAVVDVIGIGAGPVDRLREQKYRVHPFNASGKSTQRDRSGELEFLNLRAESWWHLRELLDPAYGATIALPPDDKLIGDLTAPHRGKMSSGGKLSIESKDDIRKRIGRSTDDGDAVVMAFYSPRGKGKFFSV